MAFNWGFGDLVVLTKLAWDLYHGCFLVAKEAPDDFRQLVTELGSLQSVLKNLRDDVNSDHSFVDKLDDSRKEMLERCLATCFDTLRKLQKLVIEYQKLGIGDGIRFWKRMKWVSKQGEITDLKSKISVHTCNISLCMSSIGNSSLARIEAKMITAIDRLDDIGEAPYRPNTESTFARDVDAGEGGAEAMGRQFTGSTLIPSSSSDSTALPSEADSFDPTLSAAATMTPITLTESRGRRASNEVKRRIPLPSPLKAEYLPGESMRIQDGRKISSIQINLATKKVAPDMNEIISEAKEKISKYVHKEQSNKRLKVRPQDPLHTPDESLKEHFQSLANEEMEYRRINIREWLRLGTWWLLKARFHTQSWGDAQSPNAHRESFSISTKSMLPANQAYLDLLKASWILYQIVLNGDHMASLQANENRKLLHNLSDGICEEFNAFRPIDIPSPESLNETNLQRSIWEDEQPEEVDYGSDKLLGLDNDRWITAEEDDAGEEAETVLFRTFVDAAIGGKNRRVRSKGAPYMLILSTTDGESEPKVTVCNQSGSLGLTKDFAVDDLQLVIPGETKRLPLKFGDLDVLVQFSHDEDHQKLMQIPQAYFHAVRRREPRELDKATETLTFKSSAEIIEQLKPSTMKPISHKHRWSSCDVRILETICTIGWRTTRRLVISSSANEEKPWCMEFFLPLSRVQVRREGVARQVTVKFSDCTQEDQPKTDGNWHPIYNFIYDDHNPNNAFSFLFRNEADANEFVNTVLHLSMPPIYSWSSPPEGVCCYVISDSEPNPMEYKAILLTHSRMEWTYSELYYMFRDTEYDYDRLSIRFHRVDYVDYVSSHVDKLYKPPVNEPPKFSHCVKKPGLALVEFPDESISLEFMSALSAGHKLIFSRRADYITTKAPSRFGSAKSNKGNAEIQLWRKGNSTRLVSRWGDAVDDKWLSMAIPTSGLTTKKDSNRVSIPRIEFNRGRKIDLANLVARDARGKTERRNLGYVTIAFESFKDREEFVAVHEGREPSESKTALQQLLEL